MKLPARKWWLAAAVLAVALLPLGADYYYKASPGAGCARCHEIRSSVKAWTTSTHRGVTCTSCHAPEWVGNVRRVVSHLQGDLPERVKLRTRDVPALVERCRSCHQQEFAQWQYGPHSVTYARIFTDAEHNRQRALMDDCFRCHGMHYEGAISDLVQPVNAKGPWRLTDPGLATMPSIPCLACHAVHLRGEPMRKPAERKGTIQETVRPSLALFDRRERLHWSVAQLPLPQVREGGRVVRLSPDRRQTLCYQCHAPLDSLQLGSGDDRTPTGVHEGLSCLACHKKHGMDTRASCAECHPRLSNCGLDVEKMDTTFADLKSRHNVHWVKCQDCHPKGVPRRRAEPVL